LSDVDGKLPEHYGNIDGVDKSQVYEELTLSPAIDTTYSAPPVQDDDYAPVPIDGDQL
jgi:hypothetical protein